MSREVGIPLLITLPIDIELREAGDRGIRLMTAHPDSATGRMFLELADKVTALEGKRL